MLGHFSVHHGLAPVVTFKVLMVFNIQSVNDGSIELIVNYKLKYSTLENGILI